MLQGGDFNSSTECFNTTEGLNGTHYVILMQPVHMIVIYSIAYSIVFVCALLGNCMVVAVVLRNVSMHTVTNYFIANLAVADILVAIFCVPITLITNLYGEWLFGPVMCKVTPYLQGVSVCASVNTLAAIAVDRYAEQYGMPQPAAPYGRDGLPPTYLPGNETCKSLHLKYQGACMYLAICKSMKFKIGRKTCKIIIFGIWLSSLIIIIPWAVFYTQVEYQNGKEIVKACIDSWPSKTAKTIYFLSAIFFTCYTVPLILITVCYLLIALRVWKREQPGDRNSSSVVIHKSKVNVLKMLALVVVLFAFSWMPLYVANFILTFRNVDLPIYLIPFAQWLGTSNSGMNPIIYCVFSKRFRDGFKGLITCFKFLKRSPSYVKDGSSNQYRLHSDEEHMTRPISIKEPKAMSSDNYENLKPMLNTENDDRLINGSKL